jgi:hypothetical protein
MNQLLHDQAHGRDFTSRHPHITEEETEAEMNCGPWMSMGTQQVGPEDAASLLASGT